MMDVFLFRIGAQGGVCVSILAGEASVGESHTGDIKPGMAEKVARRVNDDRVAPLKLKSGGDGQV